MASRTSTLIWSVMMVFGLALGASAKDDPKPLSRSYVVGAYDVSKMDLNRQRATSTSSRVVNAQPLYGTTKARTQTPVRVISAEPLRGSGVSGGVPSVYKSHSASTDRHRFANQIEVSNNREFTATKRALPAVYVDPSGVQREVKAAGPRNARPFQQEVKVDPRLATRAAAPTRRTVATSHGQTRPASHTTRAQPAVYTPRAQTYRPAPTRTYVQNTAVSVGSTSRSAIKPVNSPIGVYNHPTVFEKPVVNVRRTTYSTYRRPVVYHRPVHYYRPTYYRSSYGSCYSRPVYYGHRHHRYHHGYRHYGYGTHIRTHYGHHSGNSHFSIGFGIHF